MPRARQPIDFISSKLNEKTLFVIYILFESTNFLQANMKTIRVYELKTIIIELEALGEEQRK